MSKGNGSKICFEILVTVCTSLCCIMYHNSVNLMTEACASISLGSSLRLWDLATGEKVGSIGVGPVDIWTIAFSRDDKFIISGSRSGKIALYGIESGKQERTLDTRGKCTLSVAYVSRELITCI